MLKVGSKINSEDLSEMAKTRKAGYNIVLNRKGTKVRFVSKSKNECLEFVRKHSLDRFGTSNIIHSEIPRIKITQKDIKDAMRLHWQIAESRERTLSKSDEVI